jgi:hypothetical protein
VMGAIVLAGFGLTPERGGSGAELVAATATAAGIDGAEVFRWVFVAALVVSLMALFAIVRLEERPLRGPATVTPPAE